ncbi:Aste57867_18207 [Aphanomyces stellatus]|uniref:Aste57867_18207 protein n=1 Tax=Aphanomyces stellatus TaxID=120398 RepID=A0A485LD75_9STRA|nr:hypothetical protein As57867_018145 [Aphanomyces stellatus]VFT94945.1 Aste57867_18207 [Aphanomyces stellatus]
MERGLLQQHAEQSRFVDGRSGIGKLQDMRIEETNAPQAVGYSKDRYDPEHPDADWGGVVNRTFKKRIYRDHAPTHSNIAPSQGGLLPALTDKTPRSTSKRIFEKDIKFCSADGGTKDAPFQSAVHQIGPGGKHDCTEWKTSYAAQMEHKSGSMDDRAAPGKVKVLSQESHRRLLQPLHEQGGNNAGSGRTSNGAMLPRIPPANTNTPKNSRGDPRVESRRSILAGLGQSLAASDALHDIKRPTPHVHTGFDNPANKSLLVENHHKILLGYTGGRRDL